MLKCEEISRLVSDSMERRLSLWQRLQLRMHLALCRLCAGHAADLKRIREVVREHHGTETESEEPDLTLSDRARRELEELVQRRDET